MNVLYFFTTYTFGLSVLSRFVQFPPLALDMLRGAVWIVWVALVYVYVFYGLKPIKGFYARLGLDPQWTVLYDAVVHVAPIVLVGGLPQTIAGYVGGYLIFLGWYLGVRVTLEMPTLYLPEIPKYDYDRLVGGVIPLALAASWGIRETMKK
jgi:hypothetical protein